MRIAYSKFGLKAAVIYLLSLFIMNWLTFVAAANNYILLIELLFISLAVFTAIFLIAFHYFMNRLERKVLSHDLDACLEDAIRKGASPKKVEEMEAKKEKILNLLQKI